MPFINWVKTPDGYKPVEITDEEMKAQNAVKKEAREKAERIREQLEIVNDKNFDRIKDSIPVPKVEPVNCKDCDDTVCCERGKDKLAYCPRCFETKEKKMEFDKSRVYTALNADELKAGDKVITARCMADLKTWVEADAEPNIIELIQDETNTDRFTCKCHGSNKTYDSPLAYLVEKAENCLNCEHCGECNEPKLFDQEAIKRYNCRLYKRAKTEKAEKHYRPFKDTDELIKVWEDKIKAFCDEIPPIVMPLIWVRYKDKHIPQKGTLIRTFFEEAVSVDEKYLSLETLFKDYEFLDGSPCGVEE